MVETGLSTGCAVRESLWNSAGQSDSTGLVTFGDNSGKAQGKNITVAGDSRDVTTGKSCVLV